VGGAEVAAIDCTAHSGSSETIGYYLMQMKTM
jgi:hypothetical protein